MASETYPLRIEVKLMKMAQKQATIENRTVASLIRHALSLYLAGKKVA